MNVHKIDLTNQKHSHHGAPNATKSPRVIHLRKSSLSFRDNTLFTINIPS